MTSFSRWPPYNESKIDGHFGNDVIEKKPMPRDYKNDRNTLL